MGIEIIFKIAGVGIITAIVGTVLRKFDKDEIATFVSIAGLIIVVAMVVDMGFELVDSVRDILGI